MNEEELPLKMVELINEYGLTAVVAAIGFVAEKAAKHRPKWGDVNWTIGASWLELELKQLVERLEHFETEIQPYLPTEEERN